MQEILSIDNIVDFNKKHLAYITEIFCPVKDYLGVNNFRVTINEKSSNRYLTLSSNSDFIEEYINLEFDRICPLLHNGKNLPKVFLLEALLVDQIGEHACQYINLLHKHQLSNAICINQECSLYRYILEFSTGSDSISIYNRFFSEYGNLPIICDYIFERISKSLLNYYSIPKVKERKINFMNISYASPLASKQALLKIFNYTENDNYQTTKMNDDLLSKLSRREVQIIIPYAKGFTAKFIATKLCISIRTVETHITNIKSKINCNRKADISKMLFNIEC